MDITSRNDKKDQMLAGILLHLIEFRSSTEGPHFLRIQMIEELLLDRLREKTDRYSMTEHEKQLICVASSLHDIGKIAIPSEILDKPGRLTPGEYEIMKRHTVEGARILKDLPLQKDGSLLHFAYQICRWHHERYDGRGYPDGLVGDEIPIAAQVTGIADAYDALSSKRVYKDAYSHQIAVRMIQEGECGTFNPILLECLTECSDELERKMKDLETDPNYEEKRKNTMDMIARSFGTNVVKPPAPAEMPYPGRAAQRIFVNKTYYNNIKK
jgi:response regulator RpfG family c-di-GMP phosphodiesterase